MTCKQDTQWNFFQGSSIMSEKYLVGHAGGISNQLFLGALFAGYIKRM
jgi:REP element-mobilizing transposase RayT